jgi:hypothetical protein
MKTLPIERDIARELKIKVSQIMEWSTGKIEPQNGEAYIFLKDLGVHVVYKPKITK